MPSATPVVSIIVIFGIVVMVGSATSVVLSAIFKAFSTLLSTDIQSVPHPCLTSLNLHAIYE